VLELCKVYIKLDQPNTALDVYRAYSERHPGDLHSLLGIARIYDQLNDMTQCVAIYKQVLSFDSSNVEAISCLASNFFYTDQPGEFTSTKLPRRRLRCSGRASAASSRQAAQRQRPCA
jgi:tetratricopeptide repeat protein 8